MDEKKRGECFHLFMSIACRIGRFCLISASNRKKRRDVRQDQTAGMQSQRGMHYGNHERNSHLDGGLSTHL